MNTNPFITWKQKEAPRTQEVNKRAVTFKQQIPPDKNDPGWKTRPRPAGANDEPPGTNQMGRFDAAIEALGGRDFSPGSWLENGRSDWVVFFSYWKWGDIFVASCVKVYQMGSEFFCVNFWVFFF